jgi:hypothetical protein|tara:strand:+ start:14492 stop:14725 length:234 start_codon:yes stop_codon:yes gene_type:complete
MEEVEKSFKFLSDCAEVAEKIKQNKNFLTTTIKINVAKSQYPHLLKEIEEFVRVRVDRTQETISISINDVEFIFYKV